MSEFPDAGPHASPDQLRAAEKRQAALAAAEGRSAAPEERHTREAETAAPKRAAKRTTKPAAKKKA